jgi:hypothetical protein
MKAERMSQEEQRRSRIKVINENGKRGRSEKRTNPEAAGPFLFLGPVQGSKKGD